MTSPLPRGHPVGGRIPGQSWSKGWEIILSHGSTQISKGKVVLLFCRAASWGTFPKTIIIVSWQPISNNLCQHSRKSDIIFARLKKIYPSILSKENFYLTKTYLCLLWQSFPHIWDKWILSIDLSVIISPIRSLKITTKTEIFHAKQEKLNTWRVTVVYMDHLL